MPGSWIRGIGIKHMEMTKLGIRVRLLKKAERELPPDDSFKWAVETYVLVGRKITEQRVLSRHPRELDAAREMSRLLRIAYEGHKHDI